MQIASNNITAVIYFNFTTVRSEERNLESSFTTMEKSVIIAVFRDTMARMLRFCSLTTNKKPFHQDDCQKGSKLFTFGEFDSREDVRFQFQDTTRHNNHSVRHLLRYDMT